MDDNKQPSIKDFNEELKAHMPNVDEPSAADETADTDRAEESKPSEAAEDKQLPPDPVVPEEMLVESEIEPPTEGTNPAPVQAAPEAADPTAEPSAAPAATPIPSIREPKGMFDDKKRLAIIATAVLLVFAVGTVSAAMLLSGNNAANDTASENSAATASTGQKLGIAVTVADGTVEYVRGEGGWQPVTTETELEEGDTVRTMADSRAVLTLDDGSAMRLDAGTVVKIVSLDADDVEIEQIEGMLYSRVVPSERGYTVDVDGTVYEALGTAFATMKKSGENGVQVYQSSVRSSGVSEAIAEGKQYYETSIDAALEGKITDIDIDKLADDAFITWNLTEDEKDTKFASKLGVLGQIKQLKEEKQRQQEAKTEEEKQALLKEAEKAATEKKESEKKPDHSSKERVTRGAMSLDLSRNTFSWSYTGKAVHGYKLVYSKNPNPLFTDSQSVYFDDINSTSGSLPGKDKMKDGAGTYYVRVCAYTAGTEEEPCVDYSGTKEIIVR